MWTRNFISNASAIWKSQFVRRSISRDRDDTTGHVGFDHIARTAIRSSPYLGLR
jgi:hypothetical protein